MAFRDKCKFYTIKFYEDRIITVVTSDTPSVHKWIDNTYRAHGDKFLVGLDTEWQWDHETRDYEVAVLQLCVGHHCLVYQLSHSKSTPQSLIKFLGDENVTFVAKEVREDVTRLARQGLHVKCAMDVAHMAAKKYKDNSYKSMGLKKLAMEFLNKEMEKGKKITRSLWGNERLNRLQVEYACIDAFVSFQLGVQLQMPYSSEERMKCIAETKNFCINAYSSRNSNRKKYHIIKEEIADIGDYSKIVPTGWFIEEEAIDVGDYSKIVPTGWFIEEEAIDMGDYNIVPTCWVEEEVGDYSKIVPTGWFIEEEAIDMGDYNIVPTCWVEEEVGDYSKIVPTGWFIEEEAIDIGDYNIVPTCWV